MTGRRRTTVGRMRPDRIRRAAVVLAGAAGAAAGLIAGLVWQLSQDGSGLVAFAIGTLGLTVGLVVAFQLVQARALAAVIEQAQGPSRPE